MKDQLDLLAGVLLEGGDDLPDRLVLLRVLALIPPHDEVGGPGAERRHGEHRDENRSSAAHVVTSPIGRTASISSLPVRGNVRAKPIWRGAGQWDVKAASGHEATKADASNKVRSLPISRPDWRMMIYRRNALSDGMRFRV